MISREVNCTGSACGYSFRDCQLSLSFVDSKFVFTLYALSGSECVGSVGIQTNRVIVPPLAMLLT